MAIGAKSKVFVSYSRHDLEFTDQLVEGLEETGEFDLLIDREGIGHGEDWQARLRRLILECDTMVFVLSPDSIVSDVCAWETEEALRLLKTHHSDTMAASRLRPGAKGIERYQRGSLPQ